MLVLSRSVDEIIDITLPDGTLIEVVMVDFDTHSGRVRIGVNAPRSIQINRREISNRIEGVKNDTNKPKKNARAGNPKNEVRRRRLRKMRDRGRAT